MKRRSALQPLALLALLALAGCAAAGNTSTQQQPTTTAPTATAAPPTQALTYIGSNGNIWEMTWPQGQPKQLTNDAQAGALRYSGLAWSPDGSRLAVLRESGPQYNPTADELRVLAPDGTVMLHLKLPAAPYNAPFSWSPDGTSIAYREATNQFDPSTGNARGKIIIVDAQSGATKETVTYDDGGVGCGGAFPPLLGAVMAAHQAYQGLDTFLWSADAKSMLVARGCGNSEAARVDLSNGNTTPGFPAGASFQPGGNLILGDWSDQTGMFLGLADQTGAHQKVLVSAAYPSQNGPTYDNQLGQAVWSPDGKTVYYERENSIWSVGTDGSNPQKIFAGAADDSQMNATVDMLPSPSPDGTLLLYLQLHGSDILGSGGNQSPTSQWYVGQPDGASAMLLPQSATWAVWRPVK